MADTDHDLLRTTLQGWLGARIDDASNIEISDFKAPDAGASNETLLFEARFQRGGGSDSLQLVARLQPTEAGVFPEYDLEKQYRTMNALQGTGVAVPRLLGLETSCGLLGTPFYVMERLPGKVITENPPYHLDGWFKNDMDDTQRGEVWSNGIRTIAHINRQDWQALGMDFLKPAAGLSPLQELLNQYAQHLAWAEELAGKQYQDLHTALDWLQANQPADETVALCWGDAKTANLLVEDTRVSGVLDWEMVHLGNPVHDLAWWFTLDDSLSYGLESMLGERVPKLGGLLSRQQMVDLWQQESGYSAEQLPYYELLGAFQFGVVMARIGKILTDLELMPAEIKMDEKSTATPVLHRHMARQGLQIVAEEVFGQE